MAATGIGNSVGAVAIDDFGSPRILSMTADVGISGGVLAYAAGTGGSNVVSSGLNSFGDGDLIATKDASGLQFTGIALEDTASGNVVPIAMDGVFILQANATVTSGHPVSCDGQNAVANAGSALPNIGHAIGRALTGASSGLFCIVNIGL